MSPTLKPILLSLSVVFFLAACSGDGPSNTTSPQDSSEQQSSPEGIAWFDGSIDEAFALAKAADKPLYLYWGAVWCPPCEEINQTVFKDPNFIAQSRLFIPVYLDGDTGRAQTWGETFAVQGYPTMIILNPAGEEVTRIPGAIDVALYNDVLQLSLDGLQPTSQLIERALDSPALLSAENFTQLAYYSWDQENLDLSVEANPALLKTLSVAAADAGNELAASRLFLQSLVMAYSRDAQLSEQAMAEAQQRLQSILSDQRLILANFDFSMFSSEALMRLITEPGDRRKALSESWAKAMQTVRYHPSLSKAEQLGSWYPQLHLYWLNTPDAQSLPNKTLAAVRKHVAEIDRSVRGSARQTAINKAYQVLQAARLYDESRELLLAEIEKSESPYYFMSGLASLAEKQDDFATASDWLERAYENADGKATRFQWGVEYVTGLIRMQPKQIMRISDATESLLDNLEEPGDVFAGRNFGRLQTLDAALRNWRSDAERQTATENFYARLKATCAEVDKESIAYRNCSSLSL